MVWVRCLGTNFMGANGPVDVMVINGWEKLHAVKMAVTKNAIKRNRTWLLGKCDVSE